MKSDIEEKEENNEVQRVLKWHQGKQNTIPVVDDDEGKMRNIVYKDFVLYFFIYLIPPLAPWLNKFTDYPLPFTGLKWITSSSILSVMVVFTTIVLASMDNPYVSGIEKWGALFAFILRCFLTTMVEAMNIDADNLQHLELDKLSLVTPYSEQKLTAKHLYQSIMDMSNFSASMNIKDLKKNLGSKALFYSIIVSVSIVCIPTLMRILNRYPTFGGDIPSAIFVVTGAVVIFIVSVILINAFFIGFALYRSMTSSMVRLKNVAASTDEEVRHKIKSKSHYQPHVVVNVTVPSNLRAWMRVHEALALRSKGFEVRILRMGATIGLILLAGLAALFVFETIVDTTPSHYFSHISSFEMTTAHVATFLVTVLAVCMVVLCYVGNQYNQAAKKMQIRRLYEIEITTTLNMHCNFEKLSREERKSAQNAAELLAAIQKHIQIYVSDLGLLGFSYSKVFGALFTMFGTLLTRQFLRLL